MTDVLIVLADALRPFLTRSAQEPGATAPVAGTSGGGSADREAAAAAPEPALRPMAEAPRDGTWVLVRFRNLGAVDSAGPAPPLHLARWAHSGYWMLASGVTNDTAFAGWLPLPGAEPAPAWRPIETAPKDGTRVLIAWGDTVVIGHWLDNSHTSLPWAGWRHEGMYAARGRPRAWRPLPPLPPEDDR